MTIGVASGAVITKGQEGGECMRSVCSNQPASFFNHKKKRWYCESCKSKIWDDPFNQWDWHKRFPDRDYPLFETRDQLNRRMEKEKTNESEHCVQAAS